MDDMTLEEIVAELREDHLARVQYDELIAKAQAVVEKAQRNSQINSDQSVTAWYAVPIDDIDALSATGALSTRWGA